MTIVLYEAKDSGDLKLVEAREEATPELAVDAFLDENPRNKLRSFVYLDTEDLESGTFGSVEVTNDAPVQPKRAMKVSRSAGETGLLESTEETEAPAPKPARRTAQRRKPAATTAAPKAGTKKAAAKKPASKPAAAKKPAAKPPVKKAGSPFKRNPKSDE